MDNDQTYDQLIPVVLQDLQCFLTQKIHQNLIFAILSIKKHARKNSTSQFKSIDRKSQASYSQRNYSSKKSEISVHSQSRKAKSKQKDISEELINGAESLNQIRKKGLKQKLNTEAFQNFNQQKSERGRYSNPISPININQQSKPNGVNVVPRLVGLVSSQQISDIQHHSGHNSRHRNKSSFRNYQRSIVEVQDDDDQFQDIVLNRLEKIEQKVNQMLRQKRSAKIQGLRHKNTHSYHVPHYPLQTVGSGANIIYSNQLKDSQFYKHRQPKYNKSAAIMTPKMYTFQNSINKDFSASSRKNINTIKPNLTERISNPQQTNIHNNYLTDNQQYCTDIQNAHKKRPHPQNSQVIQDRKSRQNQEISEAQVYSKNKTLGHYRESQDALNLELINKTQIIQKKSSEQNLPINYQKIIKQPLDKMSAFKYIPMSKGNTQNSTNKQKYEQQKTERQMNNKHKMKVQNVSFVEKPRHTVKYIQMQQERPYNQPVIISQQKRVYHRYEPYQQHPQYNSTVQIVRQSFNRIPNPNNRYRSGKDSGVRNGRLQNSGVKAYTEHDTYQNDLQNLSISSQKNLYSEIQKLKQITKQRQLLKNKRRQDQQQKKRIKIDNSKANSQLEYRYHQKTQRPKYMTSKQGFQRQQDEQQIIIQGKYPEQRVVRVVKYGGDPIYNMPSHNIPPQNRMQRTEYVRYADEQPLRLNMHSNQQPIYILKDNSRPSPRYYEERVIQNINPRQNYKYYQHNESSKPVYEDQVRSHRKLSSGSLNSFKSIPYNKNSADQQNPLINEYITQKRSVEYIVQKPGYYVKSENRSQY